MAKYGSWGEEKTDPGAPGDSADSTSTGSAREYSDYDGSSGRGRGDGHAPRKKKKVHLGPRTSAVDPDIDDKTRVAPISISPVDENLPEATVVVSNPFHSDPEPSGGVGEDDATCVGQNPLLARRSAVRLRGRFIIIAGKEEGREIEVLDGTKVIGRSKDCDITILDIQMSRRHLEVKADHNGVQIVDLGSGNGTFVNDEVVESVSLVHGDEIAIGDHLLRFEEEGPVASALPALINRGGGGIARNAPAEPSLLPGVPKRSRHRRSSRGEGSGKKKVLAALGATLFVFVAIGVALVIRPPVPDADVADQTIDSSRRGEAEQLFSKGVQSFREERYRDALALFEEVFEKHPDHREAGRFLLATRREIAAGELMVRAGDALADEDYEGARDAYKRIDEESLRYSEAKQRLLRVDQAEARAIVIEADALLADDDLEDARELYRRALTVLPDYDEAKDGLERANQREGELRRMTRAQRARQAQVAKRRRAQKAQQAQAQVRRALAVGENQFDQGNFQQAADTFSELTRSGNSAIVRQAKQKAEALRAFRPAYEKGMIAAENRAAEQAINDLAIAERHARTIKNNGRIHKEIRERLADMSHLQGRIAFNSKRYQVAYQNWAKALEMSPGHRYSRQGMDDLQEIGEELYLEAYMIRSLNRDEASRKFRQVIAMTPSNFEYHQRAKQRLDELER